MARSGQGGGLKESAALCILARDCGEALPSFLKSVETLRSSVAGSRVFIVENNSRDSTKEVLKDYADSTPGVVLDSFDDPEYDSLERIERMTLLRNRCLDLVYRDGFRADLLIVADGDIEFDASSVIGAVRSAPEGWAALFANGRYFLRIGRLRIPALYYDLFACLPDGGGTESLTEEEMLFMRASVQRKIRRQEYVSCRSAFGGMGVYRFEPALRLRYGLEKSTAGDRFVYLSEHIPFHRMLRKSGELYICRGMKVLYEPLPLRVFFFEAARDLRVQKAYVILIRCAASIKKLVLGKDSDCPGKR